LGTKARHGWVVGILTVARKASQMKCILSQAFVRESAVALNDRWELLEIAHQYYASDGSASGDKQERWQGHRNLVDDHSVKVLALKLVANVTFGKRRRDNARVRDDFLLERVEPGP
jgi:hypothetical protein